MYLLNIFATAVPKLKQKISKILAIVNHRNWLNDSPPLITWSSTSSYHITCWIRYFPRRRSWPDFVWSLSLLFLAISFDHMHPLSPVHFSSSHSLPTFSTFVSVFLFLYNYSLQISKPSLSHFHLLSSKHDRTTVYCLL